MLSMAILHNDSEGTVLLGGTEPRRYASPLA